MINNLTSNWIGWLPLTNNSSICSCIRMSPTTSAHWPLSSRKTLQADVGKWSRKRIAEPIWLYVIKEKNNGTKIIYEIKNYRIRWILTLFLNCIIIHGNHLALWITANSTNEETGLSQSSQRISNVTRHTTQRCVNWTTIRWSI